MKLFCSLLNLSAGHSNTLVLRIKHSLRTAPNFLREPSLPGRSTSGQTSRKNRAQVSPTLDPCPLQIEPLLPFLAGGTPGAGGKGLSAECGERPGDLGRGRGGRGPGEGAEGEGMRGWQRRVRRPGARRRRAASSAGHSCAGRWDVQRVAEEGVGRGAEAGGGGAEAEGGGAGAGRLDSLEAGAGVVGATAATPGVAGVCECSPLPQRGRPCSRRGPRLRLVPRSGRPAVRREPGIAARPQVTVPPQGSAT